MRMTTRLMIYFKRIYPEVDNSVMKLILLTLEISLASLLIYYYVQINWIDSSTGPFREGCENRMRSATQFRKLWFNQTTNFYRGMVLIPSNDVDKIDDYCKMYDRFERIKFVATYQSLSSNEYLMTISYTSGDSYEFGIINTSFSNPGRTNVYWDKMTEPCEGILYIFDDLGFNSYKCADDNQVRLQFYNETIDNSIYNYTTLSQIESVTRVKSIWSQFCVDSYLSSTFDIRCNKKYTIVEVISLSFGAFGLIHWIIINTLSFFFLNEDKIVDVSISELK